MTIKTLVQDAEHNGFKCVWQGFLTTEKEGTVITILVNSDKQGIDILWNYRGKEVTKINYSKTCTFRF